jgi:eukaryotic-like serine/threonine-protein kinase
VGDRYQIEREIGRGGMATVYLAEDTRHGRLVALKVLQPELARAVGQARFRREIAIAAQLQHPHILPLLDSGEGSSGVGPFWYTMPYVEGESLRARLSREQQLPLTDALRITREVASALDYAHRRGVVHRDVKPENILIQGGHAVITDFGVARALLAARGGRRLTDPGTTVGTVGYMAPEQAAGDRDIDARADVYALGVVGYEMLVGAPPFSGATLQALVAAHQTQLPVAPRDVRPEIPPDVSAAVLMALAKDPAARFQTAADLRDALPGAAELLPRGRRSGLRALAASFAALAGFRRRRP